MIEEIAALGRQAINMLGLAGASIYAGLVAVGYATEGPSYHFRFDPRSPFRSAKRLLVGVGVKATAAFVRFAHSTLDMLFEASAEVGEWFVSHSSPEIQVHVRARFL